MRATRLLASLAAGLADGSRLHEYLEAQAKRAEQEAKEKERKAELCALSTRGHNPGMTINCKDGTTYRVARSGAYIRMTMRRFELNELVVEHNHARRRRAAKIMVVSNG